MKFAILLASMFVTNFVSAAVNLDCTATAVYGGPLEESFSVEEYPEVTANKNEVSIGASSYSKADGDTITIRETASKIKVIVVTSSQDEEFDIEVNKKTKKGTVFYKTAEDAEDMADISCK